MARVSSIRLARFSAAIAALLLGAPPASVAAAGQPAKLSQIFVPEMMEAQLAPFEDIAGKAWKVVPESDKRIERRIYKIEGCNVEAAFGYGTLRSLHMKLSDRCTFDLTPLYPTRQRLPTASKLTVGEAERALGTGAVVGVCVFPCGKAYRPAVYEHIEGSQADKFIDTILEVGLIDDAAIRAASQWTKLAQKDSAKDYLKGARFNCDGRYDEMGHKLFDKVRITAIRIGYNFTEAWQCD